MKVWSALQDSCAPDIAMFGCHLDYALSRLNNAISHLDGGVSGEFGFYVPVSDFVSLFLELFGHLIYISAIPGNCEGISISPH